MGVGALLGSVFVSGSVCGFGSGSKSICVGVYVSMNQPHPVSPVSGSPFVSVSECGSRSWSGSIFGAVSGSGCVVGSVSGVSDPHPYLDRKTDPDPASCCCNCCYCCYSC